MKVWVVMTANGPEDRGSTAVFSTEEKARKHLAVTLAHMLAQTGRFFPGDYGEVWEVTIDEPDSWRIVT